MQLAAKVKSLMRAGWTIANCGVGTDGIYRYARV